MTESITAKHILLSIFLLFLVACSNGNKSEDTVTDEAPVTSAVKASVSAKNIAAVAPASAEEFAFLTKAYEYLSAHPLQYGALQPQSELAFIKMVKEPAFAHVYLQQIYHSVPVFKNQLIVHFDKDNTVYRVSGRGLPVPRGTVVMPTLSEYDISSAAIAVMPASTDWVVKQSQLLLYCKGESANLAYQVELHSGLQRQFVLIDASDGSWIKRLEGSPSRL